MDVAIFAKLKEWLGTKTDTGGSTTAGTVNGKLNAVITNTAVSTSANASGTLSQKLTYIISTLIGATGATGGSATAGTIMAKLNALLTSWTSTRAGYVDDIRNNTITSNTANSTGVLSQKLSYLTEHSGNIYLTASSTRQENKISSQIDIDSYCGYKSYANSRLMTFFCFSNGTVRMSVSAKQLSNSQTNRCKFEIYDVTADSVLAMLDMGSYVTTFTTKTVDFAVTEGHTYGIALGRTNGDDSGKYVSCNDLTFCYSRQQGSGNFSVSSI